ncbi:Long-chain-fatty-acid--CoA ligase (EC @ Long-chain fatty-acid-CoA ligase (EC, Mycobacterial subgroup FadD19 [Streptomyces globisporus]|uniref:Long-chain-fatty-acid--CoA ligase ) n=1 Tax=Streptomyces globisporus TaxID=1908 RepID=A0ABN8VAA4_STRGL|nr:MULTISPECIES: acyl-CoA synthetase [Streptomyces]RDL04968.1 acyl-CoA synthetase (AMP-forming)/AMP-acid ligase II [Streptomyces sp. HB202]WSF80946.1 acyl-CoA synthetase [Streptomyces globisporus]GGW08727.1 fatty-acyl-CoA synthase [Streptomyces globisporus]CAH9417963.1 Long-chain-fatty-acid--CoA ligase (EC @ Long-chain fatty-acid-CoA ligase (EC, Mycobacterial subgroup FadD19 [Streptomyces globisporus]
MEYNLADLFESVVDAVPDREALLYVDHPGTGAERRLTYAELDAGANRVAHHLTDAGIRPGEHLGLHLYNGVEYLQTVLGALKARIVPVNVNYRYVEEELVYLYRDADLAALVFDGEFDERVAAAAPQAPGLRHLVRVGAAAPTAGPGPAAVPFAEAEASGSPDRGFARRSADDQFIIYTGGTTGMPKGVMWRQEDLFFSGLGGGAPTGEPVKTPRELAERVAAGGDGITFFPTPPLMHGTSTLTAFIAFNFGQRVVVHRKFVPEEVLRTIEKEKVTSVSLVGDAMLRPLIDCLKGSLRGTDCSSLFSVSSSGAIMSDSVRAEFQALVPTVLLLNNFGSSESGFNGTATADSGPEKGFRVQVNARTAVVDPVTYEPVAPGEPGRIAQRGHVPLGYYNDPAKTAETFFHRGDERWVLLGDMATVDADGIVTVLGRGSQCINTGGEKVYPEEVEQALKSHADVYDALVAGVPDERWGNRVAAVIQMREGADALTLDAVQAHCRTRLAGYKIPRVLVLADRIQRSPSGKADYRWAKAVAAGAGRD